MTHGIHTQAGKIAAISLLAGVFLCLAGSTMAAGEQQMMSGNTTCQAMHLNLASLTPTATLSGMIGLALFTFILIHYFSRRRENGVLQDAVAVGPPIGSRWRMFQHVFFDTLYRQFSPLRQYVAVIVEPQTYAV